MNERVAIGGGGRAARGRHDRRRSRGCGASGPNCAPPAPRRAAAAVGRRRGGPPDRPAAAPAAGRRAARARGLGGEAGVRPARPGDQRLRGRAARRGGAGYDDWTMRRPDQRRLHRPRRRATATCGPRATPSRAAPPRSCATSSPSGCSGCRRSPAIGQGPSAMRGPDRDEHPTWPLRSSPLATAGGGRPARRRGRGRPPRNRPRPAPRPARRRRPDLAPSTRDEPADQSLWGALAARTGPGRSAGARGARRCRGVGARGRRGARGAGPRGRAGAVPDQRGRRDVRAARRAATRPTTCSAGSPPASARRALAVPLSTAPGAPGRRPSAGRRRADRRGHAASRTARVADVLLVPARRRAAYAVVLADAASP